MRNTEQWRETKWTLKDGKLVPKNVHRSSLHTATLQAATYQRAVERFAKAPIADLGCGEVPLYVLYRDIDPDPFCVDWGKSKHDVRHADWICDLNQGIDIVDIEIEIRSIDSPMIDYNFGTVCAWDMIEHLWNPRTIFYEAADMLESGGHFICAAPFMYWIHEAPHDYHRYTEYGLRKYCELAGLEVVECEPYGDANDVLLDMTAKTGFGGLTQAIMNQHRFPLGYTLIARKP